MLRTETNTQALSRMTALKLDTIALVDDRQHLLGVVEREQLVSKLLLSLCGSS
jgi:CBS-domain-containing membrane protein